MRELYETGWMHNRIRMVVGSFLVKHLRINWNEGEPQVCDVMHYTHQAFNKSDKEMVIMMMDVKMDTEVEL